MYNSGKGTVECVSFPFPELTNNKKGSPMRVDRLEQQPMFSSAHTDSIVLLKGKTTSLS